jgi:uncharacterized protein
MKAVAILASVLLFTAVPAVPQESTPTVAAESTPSDESLRRLLEVLNARKLVDTMSHQIDSMMTSTMQKMLEGQPISPKQQEAIDTMRSKMAALLAEEFNWDSMEPFYLKVYKETFSQSEIDAMIGFYSSPAGHAVVEKLPVAMQNAMGAMQERLAKTLIPKLQQMAQETAAQIKAQNKDTQKADKG